MMLLRFSQFLAAQKKFPCDFIHIAWTFQPLGAFDEIMCQFFDRNLFVIHFTDHFFKGFTDGVL